MTYRMAYEAGCDFIQANHSRLTERELCAVMNWPQDDLRATVRAMRANGQLPTLQVIRSEAVPAYLADPVGPPLKLPEGEAGWNRAADWLREWGFVVLIDRMKDGIRITIDGQPSNVALLCARFFEERGKRFRNR